MSLINDLVPEVIFRCENRTNDTARAAVWLRDALLEIASNPDYRDDFAELEELGPFFNLTAPVGGVGTQEYAESNITPIGDIQLATLDIRVWTDPPTNSNWRKLDNAHYQKTDRFQPVFSLPTEWYRFGLNIGFNPIPDKPYQIQARVLRTHPIATPIQNTLILLPTDWNEVIIWAAVQRGFMELLEWDKAGAVNKLLHGDPKDASQPGLIYSAKRKRRREFWRQESSLRVVKRPIMWGYPGR